MPRQKRKPGGQPGNLNAVIHGFYSKHMTPDQATLLAEALKLPTDDMTEDIGVLRTRLAELIENAPDKLQLMFDGLRTLAGLMRTQYHLKGSDADRLVDAMRTVLLSIEETLAAPPEPDA